MSALIKKVLISTSIIFVVGVLLLSIAVWTGVSTKWNTFILSLMSGATIVSVIKLRSGAKVHPTKPLIIVSLCSIILLIAFFLTVVLFRETFSSNVLLLVCLCLPVFLLGCGFLYFIMKNRK